MKLVQKLCINILQCLNLSNEIKYAEGANFKTVWKTNQLSYAGEPKWDTEKKKKKKNHQNQAVVRYMHVKNQ